MSKQVFVAITAVLALAACSDKAGSGQQAAPVAAQPAPAGQDWTQTVAKTDEGFVMGNPNAPIKLVEYGSRLCPTCGAFAREGFQPLTEGYVKTGKVSFEFREFLVHGAMDMPPALIGTCVGAEPFFPLLEEMFASQSSFIDAVQKAPAPVQQAIDAAPPAEKFRLMSDAMGLTDFVKQRGVSADKAQSCLTDAAAIDRLAKQTQDHGPGGDSLVTGTPTFLINGKVVQGAIGWPDVEKALKQAGA